MKTFKYWVCYFGNQYIFAVAWYSIKPKMLWASSQIPKNRLMTIEAAGGGYIKNKEIFLVEKYHRLLEIK